MAEQQLEELRSDLEAMRKAAIREPKDGKKGIKGPQAADNTGIFEFGKTLYKSGFLRS
jgi:hypothetical protein